MAMVDLDIPATDPAVRDAIARARAGELLGPSELRAILGLKQARFYELQKLGAFDRFRVKYAIGTKRYSGVIVARYLDGLPLYEPSFGRGHR